MSNLSHDFYSMLKSIGALRKPYYANEIMTPWDKVVTVDVGKQQLTKKTLAQLMTQLSSLHANHLFVSERGKLKGYLSIQDLARQIAGYEVEAKTKPIPEVKADGSLFSVVEIMKGQGTDAVVVVDDAENPLGVITVHDIQTKV